MDMYSQKVALLTPKLEKDNKRGFATYGLREATATLRKKFIII